MSATEGKKEEMPDGDNAVEPENAGEAIPEDHYKPATPDSLWTPTVCQDTTETGSILYGDFRMDRGDVCCGDLTLALIKPDGMEHLNDVEKFIRDNGFYIVQRRVVQLSPEQASNFYNDHYGQPYFPSLITSVCEGPVKALVLRSKDAVEKWKTLCGPRSVDEAKKKWPDSLRALYGTSGNDHKNVCHASETHEKALDEIRFFFPNMVLEPNILDGIQAEDYLRDYVNPTLLEGLAQVCKNKPIDPVLWLAEWLLMNNPYKPKMDKIIALTPT